MKKRFDFGKIDYENKGKALNAVTVEVEYKDKNGKKCFTASGSIWNSRHSDIVAGGQCLDTIAEYIKSPVFTQIFRLWNLYHLNDMHPECEHQAAAGWREIASQKVTLYTFTLTSETITEQNRIKRAVHTAAVNGDPLTLSKVERLILSLDYSTKTHTATLPEIIAPYYKLKEQEQKALGWLRENEHPDGILCKSCPVCGYQYGTAWKYFPIPEEDEQIIYNLLGGVEK